MRKSAIRSLRISLDAVTAIIDALQVLEHSMELLNDLPHEIEEYLVREALYKARVRAIFSLIAEAESDIRRQVVPLAARILSS